MKGDIGEQMGRTVEGVKTSDNSPHIQPQGSLSKKRKMRFIPQIMTLIEELHKK